MNIRRDYNKLSFFFFFFFSSSGFSVSAMAYRFRIDLCFVFLSILVLTGCYLRLYRNGADTGEYLRPDRLSLRVRSYEMFRPQKALREEEELARPSRHMSSVRDWIIPTTDSVLFPEWEVLVFVSPEVEVTAESGEEYQCVFHNNETSPARLDWVLPFTKSRAFKCVLPRRSRRLRPFIQPALTRAAPANRGEIPPLTTKLFRWTFLVYESFSTENDVVLFAKGVNNRQGINRPPSELRCVFGDNATTAVSTAVTTSNQEVFLCRRPDLTALLNEETENQRIKVSIEISDEENGVVLVPSVAYYTPMRTLAIHEQKSQLCASTMIYNAAKFLKEWVIYHSRIGVEKFILYDNGSDDELQRIVEELNQNGFNVETVLWPWPKTQEAGFSHSAIYAKQTCKWMLYVDVDEFVFSPKWINSSTPSTQMLSSLIPKNPNSKIGQISISCNEFGPSNQRSHPIHGVTQGYTCRRRVEQRHKSVVLLDAVDSSLCNAVHHFGLKEDFKWKKLSLNQWVVNHYKYQAWSEFKAKFRRRVSAYVSDWRDERNPHSKDRAPGLGFLPIEPKGWANKFCEVNDQSLKTMTQRWFGIGMITSTSEYKMAWEE